MALAGSDDGDWHHYCLAYDGSAWTVYFDGASAQTVTVAIDTGSNYALTLGDRTDRNGNHAFSGSIDEVYVYASALDAEQVLALSGMSMPPSAAPSPSPTAAPSSSPSAEPSPEPTATFIEITGVGDESTCVAHVDCEIRWVYRGDPSACETVDIQLVETGEDEVLEAQTMENDGEVSKTVPGDAEVNEYTVTVACSDDATISDSYDFQVSYAPAPTFLPSSAPSATPSSTPSAAPSSSPSPAPSAAPSSSPSAAPSPSPSATPSAAPSSSPSAAPSPSPSAAPSAAPSSPPSAAPSAAPSSSPSTLPSSAPSSTPSASPSLPPSAAPSSLPSVPPTQSFVYITSVGTESTCVSNIECEVLWTYRGDASACATVELYATDPDGTVVASVTTDNDGQQTKVVSGDAEASEYKLTVACSDDATISDSYDFQVSYTSAPTGSPTFGPSELPSSAPSTVPLPAPSTPPTIAPAPEPTVDPAPAPTAVPAPMPTIAPAPAPTSATPVLSPTLTAAPSHFYSARVS